MSTPFKELSQWAKNNKVTAFNFALGEREGTLEMFSHIEHSPSSSFLNTTKVCKKFYPFTEQQESIPVKLMTLDKWIRSLPNTPNPEILIKLDVQGYEDRVIRGGIETFSNAKACILEVSLDQLYEDQATFQDISCLLYDLGYHYGGNLSQIYANDGHVIYIKALFIKQIL